MGVREPERVLSGRERKLDHLWEWLEIGWEGTGVRQRRLHLVRAWGGHEDGVADLDPFDTDPDPAFHFDTDLDPDPVFQFDTNPDSVFQFDTNPDPADLYGSGSLPFQRGNVPKTVLSIYLYLIFLVSRSNRTQTKGLLC